MELMMTITTIAVALITAVFGPIAVEWAKNYFKKPEPIQNPVDEAILVNTLVDEQLDTIMEELGCDRVWVAQFHNGGHFYPTGKSIQKFSVFYEKLAPGALAIQHTFQNVPCSLFPKALAQLYKEGELAIPTYEGEDYDLSGISAPYGTKSFYMVALDDLHDRFIGVISIAYNREHKLTKDEWIFVRQKAGVVGTLLDEYLNKKK
jgi:GAF domain-containing protein